MTAALELWPLLGLPLLYPLAVWVRRRNVRRAIRATYQGHGGTSRQHSHDRAEQVQPPEEET